MTKYVIRIVAQVGPARLTDGPMPGAYVVAYDPDEFDGRGSIDGSMDPRRALRFDSATEAMDYACRQSSVRPLRPDGEPNRPLTAFTLCVESVRE